jgi:hypothetical protein
MKTLNTLKKSKKGYTPYLNIPDYDFYKIPKKTPPKTICISYDTEYTTLRRKYKDNIGLTTQSVALTSDEIKNFSFIWTDISKEDNYHPVIDYFRVFRKNKVLNFNDENSDVNILAEKIEEIENLFDLTLSVRELNKQLKTNKKAIKLLEEIGLKLSHVAFKKDKSEGDIYLELFDNKLPQIDLFLVAHFWLADFLKIGGASWHNDIQCLPGSLNQNLKLSTQKSLRFIDNEFNPHAVPLRYRLSIDGIIYMINTTFIDTMYRLPPATGGKDLQNQAIAFDLSDTKFDLKYDKGMMIKLLEENPHLFIEYAGRDTLVTLELFVKQNSFWKKITDTLNTKSALTATPGSSVSGLIKDLMIQNFDTVLDTLDFSKFKEVTGKKNKTFTTKNIIDYQLKLGVASELQNHEFNRFGIQSLLTTGGLVYSRLSKESYIEGILLDCDLKSCYSTILSNMNVFLGEPIISSNGNLRKCQTVREILAGIDKLQIPNEAWYIKATGKVDFPNTLIYSTIDHKSQKKKMKKFRDKVNRNPKLVSKFNIDKLSKETNTSKMLLNDINMGVITSDVIEIAKALPENWYNQILDLKVQFLAYFHPKLIANSIEEYLELYNLNLDSDGFDISIDCSTLLTTKKQKLSYRNISLKFPISKYWKKIKDIRVEFKKVGNKIEIIAKLILNTGYGDLACVYLPINNPVAANFITSKARCNAWAMTVGLNGFSPITDGCSFNALKTLLRSGKTLRQILQSNPEYLINYDSKIESSSEIEFNQEYFDKDFKSDLKQFLDIDYDIIFDFELKENKNNDNKKTTIFHEYLHTNCSNYMKIKKTEKKENLELSLRGYTQNQELKQYYYETLKTKYKTPFLYKGSDLLSLADASRELINTFQNHPDAEELIFPLAIEKGIFKFLKLLTSSQFFYKTEKQYKHFLYWENQLSHLLHHISSPKDFLEYIKTKPDYIKDISEESYIQRFKKKSIGTGFEILSLRETYNGNLQHLKSDLQDYILDNNELNLNKTFNINRDIKTLPKEIKELMMDCCWLRIKEDYEVYQLMVNSVNNFGNMVLTPNVINNLEDMVSLNYSEI